MWKVAYSFESDWIQDDTELGKQWVNGAYVIREIGDHQYELFLNGAFINSGNFKQLTEHVSMLQDGDSSASHLAKRANNYIVEFSIGMMGDSQKEEVQNVESRSDAEAAIMAKYPKADIDRVVRTDLVIETPLVKLRNLINSLWDESMSDKSTGIHQYEKKSINRNTAISILNLLETIGRDNYDLLRRDGTLQKIKDLGIDVYQRRG